MKIAVIGAGIAGLTVARELQRGHQITVFEAGAHAGGHAHTHTIEHEGRVVRVDTGFMVYNETTYPRFTRMLAGMGVATRPCDMGFSVCDPASGLEYCGTGPDGLFAQRSNLLHPSFLRMLAEILRFNREAESLAVLGALDPATTLGDLADRGRFGRELREHYLVPMAGAIWSSPARDVLSMPALFFVRFFHNHGLLRPPGDQLRWRTIVGGSQVYVEALARPFAHRVRLATAVRAVRRPARGVEVVLDDGVEHFDEVVFATHAPEALALLADATPLEREVLGAFRTQRNATVLHTDTSQLPSRPRARSSWNVRVPASPGMPVTVTYDVSRLQGLATRAPLLVTLNAAGIDPARVIARMDYAHPLFDAAAVAAQERHGEVSGSHRAHFCGAWWRNGFHEDGVWSGLRVAGAIDRMPAFA